MFKKTLSCYPWCKVAVLAILLIVGAVYALPNLYGSDPTIQINKSIYFNKKNIDEIYLVLTKNNTNNIKSIAFKKSSMVLRFSSIDSQLRARKVLSKKLSSKYSIALNLIPDTPRWLSYLHARPIKLGLDLSGGVRFLLKANMSAIYDNFQRKNIQFLSNDLKVKKITYKKIYLTGKHAIRTSFKNREYYFKTKKYLSRYRGIRIVANKKFNYIDIFPNEKKLNILEKSAIKKNLIILRKRMNQFGVMNIVIQRQGKNKILVELPGIQNSKKAKEILGSTATLQFHSVIAILKNKSNFHPSIQDHLQIQYTRQHQPILVNKNVIFDGSHIKNAIAIKDNYNLPQINITLDRSGGALMSQFTKHHVGTLIATSLVEYKDVLNKFEKSETIINIARIQSRLSDNFQITGFKNFDKAYEMSLLLRAGTLSTPVKIIKESIIGPTLGMKNIKTGVTTCLLGLILSVFFIIFLYKKFGLIITSALVGNLIFLLDIMSIFPNATLTMSGIAGIVLILSVAIDANVLINERIKEELLVGKGIEQAIEEGYQKSFSSIFDANVTTLIKILILYTVGSSSIKGFAITTGIGIITSTFTSIVCTHIIARLIYSHSRSQKLSI